MVTGDSAAARGATTRRIRRRARLWREWAEERQHPVSEYIKQLRGWCEPRSGYSCKRGFYHVPRPTARELRTMVAEAYAATVRELRYDLRVRFREGKHMESYHRERVVKFLAILRERSKGNQALEVVCTEIAP